MGGAVRSFLQEEWGIRGISNPFSALYGHQVGCCPIGRCLLVDPTAIFSEDKAYKKLWPTVIGVLSVCG